MSELDQDTIQTLLDLLNPLHGEIDRQTYEEKERANFDAPADAEYTVDITARMERDLCQAVCILEKRRPGAHRVLMYPDTMTKALGDVLGMMVFELSPIAHGFRAAGFQIAPKAEVEQAFVLHWLIQVAIEHGDNWRKIAGARLSEIAAQAKARATELV